LIAMKGVPFGTPELPSRQAKNRMQNIGKNKRKIKNEKVEPAKEC